MAAKVRACLRSLAWWVLAHVRASEDELDAAIRAAFNDCGVNVDLYALDLDLGTKKYEVLHHAANRLGNPLRTVADIKGLLQ
jgi:hypothetical protein